MATTSVQDTSNLFTGAMASPSQNAGVTANKLGMDSFLTLFMTQLKHQDPTNPLESYELAAQLAQFSTVSQLTELNKSVQTALGYLTSINYSQMTQMVGKEVEGVDDSIQLHDGRTSRSSFELEEPAADVTVNILNDQGKVVKTISLGGQSVGKMDVEWNGTDNTGEKAPDGKYRVQIEAKDENGNNINVIQQASGTVYAFRLDGDVPYLVLDNEDGLCIPIATIREVRKAGEEGSV